MSLSGAGREHSRTANNVPAPGGFSPHIHRMSDSTRDLPADLRDWAEMLARHRRSLRRPYATGRPVLAEDDELADDRQQQQQQDGAADRDQEQPALQGLSAPTGREPLENPPTAGLPARRQRCDGARSTSPSPPTGRSSERNESLGAGRRLQCYGLASLETPLSGGSETVTPVGFSKPGGRHLPGPSNDPLAEF